MADAATGGAFVAAEVTRPYVPAPPGVRPFPHTPHPAVPSPALRFEHCRGTLGHMAAGTFELTGHGRDILCHTAMSAAEFTASLSEYPAGRAFAAIHARKQTAEFLHAC